jgi:HEAT repeat protein
MTKSGSDSVRSSAIMALGNIHDERRIELFKGLLKDKSYIVRGSAFLSLAGTKDPSAFDAFSKAFKAETEEQLKVRLIRKFRGDKSSRVIGLIRNALDDEFRLVRLHAVWALRDYADPEAVKPLIGAFEDEPEWFKKHVAEALKGITKQDFGTNAAEWRSWHEGIGGSPAEPGEH